MSTAIVAKAWMMYPENRAARMAAMTANGMRASEARMYAEGPCKQGQTAKSGCTPAQKGKNAPGGGGAFHGPAKPKGASKGGEPRASGTMQKQKAAEKGEKSPGEKGKETKKGKKADAAKNAPSKPVDAKSATKPDPEDTRDRLERFRSDMAEGKKRGFAGDDQLRFAEHATSARKRGVRESEVHEVAHAGVDQHKANSAKAEAGPADKPAAKKPAEESVSGKRWFDRDRPSRKEPTESPIAQAPAAKKPAGARPGDKAAREAFAKDHPPVGPHPSVTRAREKAEDREDRAQRKKQAKAGAPPFDRKRGTKTTPKDRENAARDAFRR